MSEREREREYDAFLCAEKCERKVKLITTLYKSLHLSMSFEFEVSVGRLVMDISLSPLFISTINISKQQQKKKLLGKFSVFTYMLMNFLVVAMAVAAAELFFITPTSRVTFSGYAAVFFSFSFCCGRRERLDQQIN